MFKAIWSFLYEYLIGKDVRFKTAIKEHKKKLFLVLVTLLALFLDYHLGKKVLVYQKADAACLNKLNHDDEEIQKLNHEIDQLRETNLVLARKLGTQIFDIDEIENTKKQKQYSTK